MRIPYFLTRLEADDSWISELISGILDGITGSLTQAFDNIWSKISDSIWLNFVEFLVDALNNFVSTIVGKMTDAPLELFRLPVVQGLLVFFKQFGWALFIVGCIIAVFEICIEYQSMHRFNIKRQILPLLTGFMAVNLFTILPIELYKFAVDQQSALFDMMIELTGSRTSFGTIQSQGGGAIGALFSEGSNAGTGFMVILLLIIYAYSIIKVFFDNIKRGGILFTMIGVGSLHMLSIPRGYTEGFWTWSKQIVGLCVTTVLQNVLLFLGCQTVAYSNVLLGIGVVLAAAEVPRIAGQFGLDTSTRGMLSAVASTTNTAIHTGTQIARLASKAV